MKSTVYFSGKRIFGVVIIFALVFGLIMVGCGGFMNKKGGSWPGPSRGRGDHG